MLTNLFFKSVQMHLDLLEADDIGMLEFSQGFNVRLLLLTHLLDGHLLRAELSQEDGSLCTAAQPLQLRDLLEWNLPRVWKQKGYSSSRLRLKMEASGIVRNRLILYRFSIDFVHQYS